MTPDVEYRQHRRAALSAMEDYLISKCCRRRLGFLSFFIDISLYKMLFRLILASFGELSAPLEPPMGENDRCNGCDNCRRHLLPRATNSVDLECAAEALLVFQTIQFLGFCGNTSVALVLTGKVWLIMIASEPYNS
jgi:hypothetical protein